MALSAARFPLLASLLRPIFAQGVTILQTWRGKAARSDNHGEDFRALRHLYSNFNRFRGILENSPLIGQVTSGH